MAQVQKIVPNLWFDGNAQEAVEFYASIFDGAKIIETQYYPKTAAEGLADFQKDLAGQPLVIEFELAGQHFTAINAGSDFHFSEALSLAVHCADQAEIDYLWDALSAVPEAEQQCGWCKDKYGLSWQIVPANVNELLTKPGAYAKMMHMKKLVIADF